MSDNVKVPDDPARPTGLNDHTDLPIPGYPGSTSDPDLGRPGRPFGENPDAKPWVPNLPNWPGSSDGGPAHGGE